MNAVQKSLIGLGLIAALAGCSGPKTKDVEANAPAAYDTEKVDSGQVATDRTPASTEVLSTVNVRLLDESVELSNKEMLAGEHEFQIYNETGEPLNVSVIKTEIDPALIKVEEGKIAITQKSVESLSNSKDREIMAGKDVKIRETLAPGGYYVLVTSSKQAEPIAFSELIVTPQ